MLGIPLPSRIQGGRFTWEKRQSCLCMRRNLELSTCRAAIDDKWAECLSHVYPVVIRRRDCGKTENRDGEPGRFERGAQARRRRTPTGTYQVLAEGMPTFPGTGPSSGPANPQPAVPVSMEPGTPRWVATAQSVIALRCLS